MDIQSLSSTMLSSITSQRPPISTQGNSGATTQLNTAGIDNQPPPLATGGQAAPASREQLTAAIDATNAFVSSFNNSLEFTIDDDTGTTVVRIVDNETKELVRQIPSEEMLAIAKALDTIKGLLIHQKA